MLNMHVSPQSWLYVLVHTVYIAIIHNHNYLHACILTHIMPHTYVYLLVVEALEGCGYVYYIPRGEYSAGSFRPIIITITLVVKVYQHFEFIIPGACDGSHTCTYDMRVGY